jgi:hypothetical protein
MKLFEPKAANTFVFATVSATAREGTAPEYKAISATSLEGALEQLDKRKMRNACPYVMGRYDEQGRYCTYTPAIEGCKPARFILHPFAEQAKHAEGWH